MVVFKRIMFVFLYIILSIIFIFGIYYIFNGGISNLVTTTREVSFWQAIKDIFVGIYKGFMRTIGQ